MKLKIQFYEQYQTLGEIKESTPYGLNQSKFTTEKEEGYVFYRKKIETKLRFYGEDYELIKANEKISCCGKIILYFYRDCDYENPYFVGYFHTDSGTIDDSNEIYEIADIRPFDVWEYLFVEGDTKYNVLEVLPKESFNSIYERRLDLDDNNNEIAKLYLNRNRDFVDIILYLIEKTFSNTPFKNVTPLKSEIGLIFTQLLSPITKSYNIFKNLAFCQSSDFYDSNSDSPSTVYKLSLKDIIELLQSMAMIEISFNTQTQKLFFEHISFFRFNKYQNESYSGNYYLPIENITSDNWYIVFGYSIEYQVLNNYEGDYFGFREFVKTKPLWNQQWLKDYIEYLDKNLILGNQITFDLTTDDYKNGFIGKKQYSYDKSKSFKTFKYTNNANASLFNSFKSNKWFFTVDYKGNNNILDRTLFLERTSFDTYKFAYSNIDFGTECTLKNSNGIGEEKNISINGCLTDIESCMIKFPQYNKSLLKAMSPNFDIEESFVLIALNDEIKKESIIHKWGRNENDLLVETTKICTYRQIFFDNSPLSTYALVNTFHCFDKPFSIGKFDNGFYEDSKNLWLQVAIKQPSYKKLVENITLTFCCSTTSFLLDVNYKLFCSNKALIKRSLFDAEKNTITLDFLCNSACNEILISTESGQYLKYGELIGKRTIIQNGGLDSFGIIIYTFTCIGIYSDGKGGTYENIIPC